MLKNFIKSILKQAHQFSATFDEPKLNADLKVERAPIFIIGVPRSGTTLFYQLMVNSLRVAYIPNIANRFYMCPISATQYGLKFCSRYQSSYNSRYGFEKGCLAPSEAGNVWNRWFPYEKREGFNYTSADDLVPQAIREIYTTIAHHERLFEAPFISKNVKWSVRLQAIAKIFPNARIIHVCRNLLDSAVSILHIRRQKNLNWWSVLPKEIDQLTKLPDLEQVCYQILYVNQNIQEDFKHFKRKQIHRLDYESFCAQPQDELDRVLQFLKKETEISYHEPKNIPEKFSIRMKKESEWITLSEVKRAEELLAQGTGQ